MSAIADALNALLAATKDIPDDELLHLNRNGTLPNGVYAWLMACRARIV